MQTVVQWRETSARPIIITNRITQTQDDAADAACHDVRRLPPLAFDHKLVVRECLAKLAQLPEASGALFSCFLCVCVRHTSTHTHTNTCMPQLSNADELKAALKEGVQALAGDWERPTE